MASIHSIQTDLDNIIKPLLKEIKILIEKLNNQDNSSTSEVVEAAAAKIISEMKNCHCNKEILDALGSQPKDKGKIIVPTPDDEERYNKPYLYSYPNSSVGNEELGTGKNPKSLTWPFGSHTSN